ncbi:NAD(P)/FAD-dependent oxidoreductase [uncultured Aeromicrobium sp.]|uniref:NAD(P)/FAD-dependent oxidoreductase n=1 Tax=uncultured Aeromicrobium sp. TaxID=337820 RepID=UPI0025DFF262|nr:FAD-dependent oxidoreductase [uncultured Aeromicrobium sp.]
MHHVVVVGASLAGVNAIEGLRERGFTGAITLVGAERHLPYDRPPLSKEALSDGLDPERLALRPPQWYEEQGVTLRLGEPARALEPGPKRLWLESGEQLDFDGLVVATGSSVRRFAHRLCGDPARLCQLRSVDDAQRLRDQLEPGRRLVVLGAGFIGLEVAATARSLGLEVTVIDVAASPLARVLGEAGGWFTDLHTAHGVDIRCGTSVDRIDPRSGGGVIVRSPGRSTLEADLFLESVGASPAVDWLSGSGLALEDGIVCGPDLRTSHPDIVAAGDVARWHNELFGESMRVEHWTNAVEQGRHAAGTLLGERESYRSIPYFWTDQFSAKARFVGRADAADDIVVERGEDSAVILFGRDGRLRGALCINAPRRLARCRVAIRDGMSWTEAATDLATCA